ncbi:chemotaxis protein CheW [Desulfobotulus sp. H1]|uniref:Chemotaxis protein CheW n=1 Tax=Desulfobotulus pelophilus TaxID=2823377 RepID=A0ABT3NAF3_9BACT|nr:chemotaxis protein CheW [Desulfobotulus pelophilus]MCW7754410.1 chemotaxis protein CheW [Desulfobotulus pelophilus]
MMITSHNRQICTFFIGEETYGFDIFDIKEVHTRNHFTPVHHAPPSVRGYVNIRGQIHLIIDLRVLLGHPPAPAREHTRILLFKPHAGESFGVLVDRIGDVFPAPENMIAPMDDRRKENGNGILRQLARGILKKENGLVTLLSASTILKQAGDLSAPVLTEMKQASF